MKEKEVVIIFIILCFLMSKMNLITANNILIVGLSLLVLTSYSNNRECMSESCEETCEKVTNSVSSYQACINRCKDGPGCGCGKKIENYYHYRGFNDPGKQIDDKNRENYNSENPKYNYFGCCRECTDKCYTNLSSKNIVDDHTFMYENEKCNTECRRRCPSK